MKILLQDTISQKIKNSLQGYLKIFIGVILFKIALLVLFSSDYQNRLFIPFVEHFLTHFDNPWQYFYRIQMDKFPYPPLMLYIFSFAYWPYHLFFGHHVILQNLFFKLPTLAADLLIFYTLIKIFPNKLKEIILFYFTSLIILYASYMHSQLDLLPMAFFIISVYFLTTNRLWQSALFFGIAMNTKFHVVAALPLVLIFIFRNYKGKLKDVINFFLIQMLLFFLVAGPYLPSAGYVAMVLKNTKQSLVFDTFYPIGDLKIYLAIFAVVMIYARFLAYRKINNDLFYAFIGLLFSTFIFLIYPSPGWYVWLIPSLSLFFIMNYSKKPWIFYIYFSLNAIYLIYFLFFHIFEYQDLNFLLSPVVMKLDNEILRNASFTILEAVLFATVFFLYKFGVRSNLVYKKSHNFVIGIGGDSGAGKSTVLADIKRILGERLLELEGDYDHKWLRDHENWQVFTHLDPKANYLHRQTYDLLALKSGTSIHRGEYDHTSGSFTPPARIEPREFIILSGLHPFFLPLTRKIIDLKIFLDTEEKLKHHWKVLRDSQERKYAKDKVLEQIEKRKDDAKKHILPQKDFADLIIAYFTEGGFKIGDPDAALNMKLKLILNSSIHLENLMTYLAWENIESYWDYSQDLKTQFLILSHPPKKEIVSKIAKNIIPNINELTTGSPEWLDGYRGFVQLICMFVLSEKMREESDYNEV